MSEITDAPINSADLMAVLAQRSETSKELTNPTSPYNPPHTSASMQPPETKTEEEIIGTYISNTNSRARKVLETMNGIIPQINGLDIEKPLSKEYADALTQSLVQLTTTYLDNTRDMPTYDGKDEKTIKGLEQLKNIEKQFISLLQGWGETYKPKNITGSALYV
ncbi:MAG: hypothetical protein KAT91_02555 [Candidatus Aenigmarchaeota archaeon]|nr:hypothetical protein [Candidatus Aenigmarchaeota archaeon]